MKAFKSSSFSLHNRQPLTFYLLIQGLFRATLCALQQLNSFFPNYSQSPVCPALCSTLFGSPCSNFPTHSSQGCHQKQDSRTAVCLLTKKKKPRMPDWWGGVNLGLLWVHAFCREIQRWYRSAVQFEAAAFSMQFYASAYTSNLLSWHDFLILLYQPSAAM